MMFPAFFPAWPGRWQRVLSTALLVLLSAAGARAQRVLWADAPASTPHSRVGAYRAVSMQLAAVRQVLAPAAPTLSARSGAAPVLSLPLPDGRAGRFRLAAVPVMPAALAARYPQITTYAGQGLDDPTATLRLDVTPAGLHAQILSAHGTVYIDPAAPGAATHLVYNRTDLLGAQPVCYTPATAATTPAPRALRAATGEQLRTYRLAVACTGEYTRQKGGTRAGALAGIVTSINRVSGIYERELAIRLQLVAKEDSIIYLNPATDPFSNNIDGTELFTNQRIIDERIGSDNYDIGHLFCTADGGLASLGVVCQKGIKAQGGTGLPVPTGDAFDVDFVAHEIGHQFKARHTFNGSTGNCAAPNRESLTAYEPGSGSTIMAYAGICAPQNLQPNSDPYFHAISLDQISDYVGAGPGSSCPVLTATGNRAPTAGAGPRYVLPIGTPFALTGTGSDADGDALTYCWEEMDLGPEGAPASPRGNAPLFRSFLPTTSPTRTFPRLSELLSNTPLIGEVLPTYSRRLTFRLTTRDNRGGSAADTVQLPVIGTAGPFRLTEPAPTQSWLAGAPLRVAWDVARTNVAPINTQQVNILLSVDGGLTFPTVLQSGTPNDGVELVTIPASVPATAQARLKVAAADNIYFDISDQNSTIQVPTAPTFALSRTGTAETLTVCPGTTLSTPLVLTALQGFTGSVALAASGLPAGVTASFAPAAVLGGGTTQVTLIIPATLPTGAYSYTVAATSGAQVRSQVLSFQVLPAATSAPLLLTPVTGSVAQSNLPVFRWESVEYATQYELQLALDEGFTTVVATQTTADTTLTLQQPLTPATTYYWRVRGLSATCGSGPFAAARRLLVGTIDCQTLASAEVPRVLGIATTATVSSTVTVNTADNVADVNVRNLTIGYPDAADLVVTLMAPAGQRVVLASGLCPGTANLQTSFDDQGQAIACPLTTNTLTLPAEALSKLQGISAKGTWTLLVQDRSATLGGSLQGWTLELCTVRNTATATTQPGALAGVSVFPNPGAGSFQLLLDNAQRGPGRVQVLDAVGRQVYQQDFLKPGTRVQRELPLAALPAGLYLVRVQVGADSPVTLRLTKL